MTDPSIIIQDVERGKLFFNDLVHKEIFNDQIGLSKCNCGINSLCLLHVLKALEFRIEQNKFDDITEILYRKLILSIGGNSFTVFYYGAKDTPDPLTEIEILASSSITGPSKGNPVIPFPISNTPKYFWMAEKSTEPAKNKWQDIDIDINTGSIGNEDDLFGPAVIVGSFRFYDTEYKTQFDNSIRFETVNISNNSFTYTFNYNLA